MPKSNFNQLIDECEGFTKHQTCNNKISFENKQAEPVSSSLEIECETKKQIKQNATACSSASSSNIFLSKNANSRQNRFSVNHRFTNGNIENTNVFSNSNSNSNSNNVPVNVNMFKNMSRGNDVAISTLSSSSSSCIEINNETFPSLAPPRILTNKVGDSSSVGTVPKKFKNFKDAIIASAPEPSVPSPTKQKQIKALQELHSFKIKPHLPPPLLVKRDSEILAKTKNLSRFYDNEDDDDDFENNNSGGGYNSSHTYNYNPKPVKKQYDNDDSSDD